MKEEIYPNICRVWIAKSKQWESFICERIVFKNPVGYHTAKRYVNQKYGECAIKPEINKKKPR